MAKAKNQGSSDSVDMMLCIVGGCVGAVLLYMHVLKPLVHPLFFYWKWLLVMPCYFIGKYIPGFSSTLQSVFLQYRPQKLSRFDDMFDVFDVKFSQSLLDAASVSGDFTYSKMMELVSYYSPFCLIIVVPLTLLYISKIKNIRTFQTLYSRETLLKENQKVFSSIAPIVYRDVSKEYLNIGPWSMPEPPLFFSIVHKLLIVEPSEETKSKLMNQVMTEKDMQFFSLTKVYQGLSDDVESEAVRNANLVPDPKSPYIRKNNVFRADMAAGIFIRQLGLKFINGHFIGQLKRKSYQESGNYWRVVFAGMLYRFGANSTEKKKKAFPLLDRFARTFLGNGPVSAKAFTFCTEELADELWEGFDKNYRFCTEVLPFVTFEYTFMMHLASFAKKNGKLSPSDFLWLRPVDRLLYFSLDQIGARVGHVEALGPWSHYNGELVNGFGLHLPYICNAVEGLYLTLASEGWVPPHNIDYNQKEMLNAWVSESSVWKNVEEETVSFADEFAACLKHGRNNPCWDIVWEIIRPLPDFLSKNIFHFFSQSDTEYFQEHARDCIYTSEEKIYSCALTSSIIEEFNVYPLWSITINQDNSATVRIKKFLPFSAKAEKEFLYWMNDDDRRNDLIMTIKSRGKAEEDIEDILTTYREIIAIYNKITDWKYDPESNVYADMLQIQKSNNKTLNIM